MRALLALLLLLPLALGGCRREEAPLLPAGSPVEIVVATDLHYIPPELVNGSSLFAKILHSSDGKQMDYIDEIVDAFLAEVVERKPDALVLSGDISYNGERVSHERLAEKLAAVRAAGVPVFVIPGNHDIENPNAYRFEGDRQEHADSVTAKEFADIYADCGYGMAVSRDRASLSYAVPLSGDLRLILLDTASYEDNAKRDSPDSRGVLRNSTLRWLKGQLKKAQEDGAAPVVVSHHNLLPHSPLFVEDYVVEKSDKLLELYRQYGVKLHLSGHMHIQSIASGDGVWDIAGSSLAVSPEQYGVIQFRPGQEIAYHTQATDVARWAKTQGRTEEELLDFAAYSRDFFWKSSYRREYWNVLALDLTVEEKKRVSELFSDANVAYFAGRIDEVRERLFVSEGYRIWTERGLGEGWDYIGSMLEAPGGNTSLRIPMEQQNHI